MIELSFIYQLFLFFESIIQSVTLQQITKQKTKKPVKISKNSRWHLQRSCLSNSPKHKDIQFKILTFVKLANECHISLINKLHNCIDYQNCCQSISSQSTYQFFVPALAKLRLLWPLATSRNNLLTHLYNIYNVTVDTTTLLCFWSHVVGLLFWSPPTPDISIRPLFTCKKQTPVSCLVLSSLCTMGF